MPSPIRHGLDKSGPAPPRGMVLVYVMIAMVAFLGLASLAVDAGHARLVKARLQHIADASALYSASGISDGSAMIRDILLRRLQLPAQLRGRMHGALSGPDSGVCTPMQIVYDPVARGFERKSVFSVVV